MTVKAIRLENFMAFADTGWIELRPITLLFGRNSSGKSTIIRALRLLRQSLNTPSGRPLRFVDNNGVDVGSYQQVVHSYNPATGDLPPEMSFHFRCHVPEALDNVRELLNEWRKDISVTATPEDYLTISLTFGNAPDQQAELRSLQLSCSWEISNESDQHLLLAAYRLDEKDRDDAGYEWWFDTEFPLLMELSWEQAIVELPRGFLPDLVNLPLIALQHIWTKLCDDVGAFLERIEYLGPARPEPQTIYLLRDQVDHPKWGAFFRVIRGDVDESNLGEVDLWGRKTGLWREIHYHDYSQHRSIALSEITIEDNFSPIDDPLYVSLLNVGFGVSQVLPVLIQSLEAVAEQVIIIEQPELHLHVEAQGMLADFFIEMTTQGKQFFLETHSEHLLLRFQRRIAETSYEVIRPDKDENPKPTNSGYALRENDFGLFFVTRNKVSSEIEFIEADKYGQLAQSSETFQDFFRYDYEDVEKIFDNISKIKKQESGHGDNN